jgi:hypothetical protein
MNKTKQKAVTISDEAWEMAKKASERSIPETTRPKWIEGAIRKQAKKEGVE